MKSLLKLATLFATLLTLGGCVSTMLPSSGVGGFNRFPATQPTTPENIMQSMVFPAVQALASAERSFDETQSVSQAQVHMDESLRLTKQAIAAWDATQVHYIGSSFEDEVAIYYVAEAIRDTLSRQKELLIDMRSSLYDNYAFDQYDDWRGQRSTQYEARSRWRQDRSRYGFD